MESLYEAVKKCYPGAIKISGSWGEQKMGIDLAEKFLSSPEGKEWSKKKEARKILGLERSKKNE